MSPVKVTQGSYSGLAILYVEALTSPSVATSYAHNTWRNYVRATYTLAWGENVNLPKYVDRYT